jgi:phosphoribosylamine-glycine ligase
MAGRRLALGERCVCYRPFSAIIAHNAHGHSWAYASITAGSKFDAEGNILTNGGRVLGVTATGKDLKEARANAYKATEWVNFENKYMRHDIGHAIDEA